MAFDVGEIRAFLKLDKTKFDQALKEVPAQVQDIDKSMDQATKSTKKLGDETEKVGQKTDKAKSAFGSIAKIAAGIGVASYLTGAIGAASDFNETVSKSQQIFGEASKDIQNWGKDAAKNMGLSSSAAIAAAANFGNMFTQIGYTSEAAANLSKETVQMAADLGSFNNQPTAEVADKISAAFRGEYDSLQSMIPTIKAATVETEAMNMTGEKNKDNLTDQQKAEAVLSIIRRDGAKAMGDYARTADGFANSSKTLTARFEDQKAALGEKLLPVASTFLDLLSDIGIPVLGGFTEALSFIATVAKPILEALGWLIQTFVDLPGPVQAAIVTITALAMLHKPLGNIGDAMDNIKGKASALGKAMTFAFGPVGLAITAIATAISWFASSSDEAEAATKRWRGEVDDLKGSLDKATGAVTEMTRSKLAEMITGETLLKWQQFGIDTKLLVDGISQVPGASEKSSESLLRLARNSVEGTVSFQKYRDVMQKAEVTSEDLARALLNGVPPELNSRLEEVGFSLSLAADGQLKLTNNATGTSEAIQDQTGRMDALKEAYDKQNGLTKNLADGQAELAAENKAVGESGTEAAGGIEKAGNAAGKATDPLKDMEESLEAVQDNTRLAKAQLDMFKIAIDSLIPGNATLEATQKALNDQIRELTEGFKSVSEAAGFNRKTIIDSTGTINTATEAGSRLYDMTLNMKDATVEHTAEVFKSALSEKGFAGAMAEARAAADTARDSFMKKAQAIGLSRDQAAALADKYGILAGVNIPDKTFHTFAPGLAEAQAGVNTLNNTPLKDKTAYITYTMNANEVTALLRAQGNPFAMARGGMVEGGRVIHAAAGLIRQPRMMRGGEDVIHAAEPSIPWEGYVSGDPRVRSRSHGIMGELADRLGGTYMAPGASIGVTARVSPGADISGDIRALRASIDALTQAEKSTTYQFGSLVFKAGDGESLESKLSRLRSAVK